MVELMVFNLACFAFIPFVDEGVTALLLMTLRTDLS